MAADYSIPAPDARSRRVLPDALSDLSLRQLLSFRAVADEGSFHGAADALDYTQSAVSQHVMGLETALGVRLFDRGRGRRTVELTEAGRLLLRHVETITDRLQAARADLLAYAAGETGTLRVGVYQSVGTKVLPAIIGRFAEAWPGVEVRLSEAASDEGLMDMVEPGKLDLTFGVLPLPEGPFAGVELMHDPFVLVTAKSSPLAGLAGMPSLELIGEQRLIGFRSCRSTKWVESQLRASGWEPNFVFRSEDNGTVQAMASAGLGTAIVPLMAVDRSDPTIAVIPTNLEPRRIALMWHRDRYRSPASRAFVDIALDVCAGLSADLAAPPAALA
ncbi:MAG TPA: LysR family transcriptional regulator [Candidatus Limnocylindrales bacterium]|nr:LysR family transcriptional regulator [Candidatus Limnocylindrales bacterium]